MERALGLVFLGLTLAVVVLVFYLHANALGLLYWRSFRGEEMICRYFAGLELHDVTYHRSRKECPWTREAW